VPAGPAATIDEMDAYGFADDDPFADPAPFTDDLDQPDEGPALSLVAEAPAPAEAVDAGLLDELEEAIRDVERALARLDDGTYGTCEACATRLGPAELQDDPTVRFCAAHLPLRVD